MKLSDLVRQKLQENSMDYKEIGKQLKELRLAHDRILASRGSHFVLSGSGGIPTPDDKDSHHHLTTTTNKGKLHSVRKRSGEISHTWHDLNDEDKRQLSTYSKKVINKGSKHPFDPSSVSSTVHSRMNTRKTRK